MMIEGGNTTMNNKKPALLQAFYKLVYATEPAILTGKDIMYIFRDDRELIDKFLATFRNKLIDYENARFCLSADLKTGDFVLYIKGADRGPYIQFSVISEEELFLVQSSKERHYFDS